ncbi:MAG: c-type cytochrome [Saprospiraceae bacterium]|nr:c-type cytochrome [Saprospiraceae bacterium]
MLLHSLVYQRSVPCLLYMVIILWVSCTKPLPPGDPDNAGLFVPDGFEVVSIVDSTGKVRHLTVRDNGDIYVKMRMQDPEGENLALRDTDGDGKADVIQKWGDFEGEGTYGCGMRIYKDYLYFSTAGKVYRNKLTPGKLVPEGPAELILSDDYRSGEWGYSHIAKPLAFDNEGNMYVPFGAPSDVCRTTRRQAGALGKDPCPELERHSGVWRFDADQPNQIQDDGYRYATGIRSIVAMAWNPQSDALYALQHGRDNFDRSWPDLYTPWQSAMLPSEEFLKIEDGTNAGWPYYYYDQIQGKRILSPEYGGDGKMVAGGDTMTQPIFGFPGHWAPNDLLFYQGDQFPERYRHGAFIAFHGSTIRAPYSQSGYFVAFMPFAEGLPSGPWEVFADGFSFVDTIYNTSDAGYRPMGLAEGPDGSLYLSESEHGKIWRVMFKGDRESFGETQLLAMEARKQLPYIKTPHKELDNLDRNLIAAGEKMYNIHCGACHQRNGMGDGNRFPPLARSEWVTGDLRRLIDIVYNGVDEDEDLVVDGKRYNGIMPPNKHLEDETIAQILSFIRTNFGNKASTVREVDVRRFRRWQERQSRNTSEEEI